MSAPRSSSWLQRSLGILMVSAAAASVAGCGGAQDTRPATWAFIAPAIIEPTCATASCHSAVAQRAGVVLEPRDTAYKTLVLDRNFVIPMNPDDSEVMALITAQGSRRMPPDFPLPGTDIELIRQWIANGANP